LVFWKPLGFKLTENGCEKAKPLMQVLGAQQTVRAEACGPHASPRPSGRASLQRSTAVLSDPSAAQETQAQEGQGGGASEEVVYIKTQGRTLIYHPNRTYQTIE
jgi:hypothetical protein